jgi:hypothetical protein
MESASRSVLSDPSMPSFGRHGSAVAARQKLEELRGLIAERFPARPRRAEDVLATGFDPLDQSGEGGLRRGAVSEVVAPAPSGGGQGLITALLKAARRTHQYLALIDGSDGFDPQSEEPELLPYLLWVRCREVAQALQATDILVRDGNISLVLLDLRGNQATELRRQPLTVWFRLQRVIEQSGGILVVLSTRSLVSSAAVRVELERTAGDEE